MTTTTIEKAQAMAASGYMTSASAPAADPKWPDPNLQWPTSFDTVMRIARFEQGRGVALKAYRCPAGKWTCGWGETEGVGASTRWTKAYADMRFVDSLTQRVEFVLSLCRVKPNDHELGAMLSLNYNIGNAAFRASTVLRCHNRGDKLGASRAFGLFNKVTNKSGKKEVNAGLVKRRAQEAAWYLEPVDADDDDDQMAQQVAPESSLVRSPIMGGAAVTGATGALSLLSDVGGQASSAGGAISSIRGLIVDSVGLPQEWWPIMLIVAAVVIGWWRWRQRSEGWA